MSLLLLPITKADWELVFNGTNSSQWVEEMNSDGAANYSFDNGWHNISTWSGAAHTGGGIYTKYNFTWDADETYLINFTMKRERNGNNQVGHSGLYFIWSGCFSGTDCRDTAHYWTPTGHTVFNALTSGCWNWDNGATGADDASTVWFCTWEHNVYRNSTALFTDNVTYNYTQIFETSSGDVETWVDGVRVGGGTVGAVWLAALGSQGYMEIHISSYPYNTDPQSMMIKDFYVYRLIPSCNWSNITSDTTLTENKVGQCYNITGNNIEFNCDGHNVTGYNETITYAVNAENVNNFNLTNCNFYSYLNAVNLHNVTDLRITNNTFNDGYYEEAIIVDNDIMHYLEVHNAFIANNNFSNIVLNATDSANCYNHDFNILKIETSTNLTFNNNDFGTDNYMSEYQDSDDLGGCQPKRYDFGYNIYLEDVNYTDFSNSDFPQSKLNLLYDLLGDNNYMIFNNSLIENQTISTATNYATFSNINFNGSRVYNTGVGSIVEYCNVTNPPSIAISFGSGSSNIIARYNNVYGNQYLSGIYAAASPNCLIEHNYINNTRDPNTQGGAGIKIMGGSQGCVVQHNTIDNYNASSVYGGAIFILTGSIKIINNTILNGYDGSGITMYLANYNAYVINNTIQTPVDWDVYNVVSRNLTLINNDFNKSNVANYPFIENPLYNYYNGYYVWVNVTDQDSLPLSGVNVSVYNRTGGFIENKTTDADGLTSFLVIEYMTYDKDNFFPANGTCYEYEASWTCYTPHNFTADNGSHQNSTIVNVNTSQTIYFTLYGVFVGCPTSIGNWNITENTTCYNQTINHTGNLLISENIFLRFLNVSYIHNTYQYYERGLNANSLFMADKHSERVII